MNISARRQDFEEKCKRYEAQGLPMTDADRKRYITSIRLSMGQVIEDDDIRRVVQGWLWGLDSPLSTSDLTDAQLFVMKKWLQPLPVGEDWTINRVAQDEIIQFVLDMVLPPMVQAAVELGGVVTDEGEEPRYSMDLNGNVETVVGNVSKAVWDEHAKRLADEVNQLPDPVKLAQKTEYFTFD